MMLLICIENQKKNDIYKTKSILILVCSLYVFIRFHQGIGIYFFIKRCVVLFLHQDNGTFMPPPYLDSHGETDIGLK